MPGGPGATCFASAGSRGRERPSILSRLSDQREGSPTDAGGTPPFDFRKGSPNRRLLPLRSLLGHSQLLSGSGDSLPLLLALSMRLLHRLCFSMCFPHCFPLSRYQGSHGHRFFGVAGSFSVSWPNHPEKEVST